LLGIERSPGPHHKNSGGNDNRNYCPCVTCSARRPATHANKRRE